MTTPRKLTVAAVALLVCGVVVALALRKPRAELALTLRGYETNAGRVRAVVVVSNRSPRTLVFRIGTDTSWVPPVHYNTKGPFTLWPTGQAVVRVSLPVKENRKVVAGAVRDYSSRLGEFRRWRDYSLGERFFDYYTLDIP